MPHELSVDVERRRCVASVYGVDRAEHMRQRFDDIVSHADWTPGMDVVIDFSKVERTEVDAVDMLEIADLHRLGRERIGSATFVLVGLSERCGLLEKTYSIARELGGNRAAVVVDTIDQAHLLLDERAREAAAKAG